VYVCEEIVVEAPKSSSGILLTPFDDKREPMRLRALYVPKFSRGIAVGDKLISQDDYQYTFTYDKKKYIQINYDHILATYE
jgi:co-chaperonin GroES (HSP10)